MNKRKALQVESNGIVFQGKNELSEGFHHHEIVNKEHDIRRIYSQSCKRRRERSNGMRERINRKVVNF